MEILIISFGAFALAAGGLSIGAILGRGPSRSGCAAVAAIQDGAIRCALCDGCDGTGRKPGYKS